MGKEIKTIEEFLELGKKALKYDFSNEGATEEYCKIVDGIEKFFIYRAGSSAHGFKNTDKEGLFGAAYNARIEKLTENYGFVKNSENDGAELSPIIIDPDSKSQLLQEIYKILWNEQNNEKIFKFYKDKNDRITGETLNSVNTTLNELYKYFEDDNEKEEREGKNISKKYTLSRYLTNPEKMKKILKTVDGLEDFFKIYHTIGNFMPVPEGCNGPRGMGEVKDYWDLTLHCIYNYYKEKSDEEIKKIVGEKKKTIYKEWLDSYGEGIVGGDCGWHRFVETNYLEDFVEEKDNEKYFPRELWKGHLGKHERVLPNNDFIEYFKNTTKCITARGNRMLQKLNDELNKEDK